MSIFKKLVWLPIIFLGIQPYKTTFYFGSICFLLVNLGYALEQESPLKVVVFGIFALNLSVMFSIFLLQIFIDSIFIFKIQYNQL